MSQRYPYNERIRLHVEGRISADDAARQQRTACALLHRLEDQPGVILADEVGMGKTFVALAAACSVALSDKQQRPVVVMVPPSLRDKWPRDFELFREKCLPDDLAKQLTYAKAERGVQFLKYLDDAVDQRRSLLFVTHGALNQNLADHWVKLALIRQALLYRKNINRLRNALARHMGKLLRVSGKIDRQDPEIWERLLNTPSDRWLKVMRRRGIDPEGDEDPSTDDDPVPQAVREVLPELDLTDLFDVLYHEMPLRQNATFNDRLKRARRSLNDSLREAWSACLKQLDLKLPLLVLDEAHHAKNPGTRLASLFQHDHAEKDADQISKGPLGGVFERMLFLTATPFQLGHHELCSVLDRFGGIRWRGAAAPPMGRSGFEHRVADLRRRLDHAQESALVLDKAWGALRWADLGVEDTTRATVRDWWEYAKQQPDTQPASVRSVISAYESTKQKMRDAEDALQPWVIRHQRSRELPVEGKTIARRQDMPGRAILDKQPDGEHGLPVEGEALLPFLLAARAAVCNPEARPVFAEGLASSYEAFLHTSRRNGDGSPVDDDDDSAEQATPSDEANWYLGRLEQMLPLHKETESPAHPKVKATVDRVLEAWHRREKLVVFCHYVATGRVLRRRISEAIRREIQQVGARKLACDQSKTLEKLKRIGARFDEGKSPLRRACDEQVKALLQGFPALVEHEQTLTEIIRRNLRTPSVLVRYFPLHRVNLDAEAMDEAMSTSDGSGLTLRQMLHGFFEFLSERCGAEERAGYLDAMHRVQTGSHADRSAAAFFTSDELQQAQPEALLPDVRLVNGAVRQDTRQRLMLTFNTPFYPDVLIASSVIAEGVDLHLNCRHVIHHDLCWNPSTLEQRTGRVDRIGAKVERSGEPIEVYLPFVGQAQDEKMYRVVMDRQRWFNVVMGKQYRVDARSTDHLAERVPLPDSVAEELRFDLTMSNPVRSAVSDDAEMRFNGAALR